MVTLYQGDNRSLLKSIKDIDLIAEQRRGTLSSSANQHSTHERDDSR